MRLKRTIVFIVLTILIGSIGLYFKGKGIEHTLSLFKFVALLLAVPITIFISLNFSPVLAPRITYRWADKKNGLLVVTTEIENISKIIALVKKDGIRFQKLKQNINKEYINDWVAFDQKTENKMKPKPIKWESPEVINSSTGHFYPGDIVRTELIYKVDIKSNEILHLGLQVKLGIGLLSFFHPEQWTTTCFVTSPLVED